jgi:hypothetical protein
VTVLEQPAPRPRASSDGAVVETAARALEALRSC